MRRSIHTREVIKENLMKFILGIFFVILAVISSTIFSTGMYPILSAISMWGAINASLICFLFVDQRAHDYHQELFEKKAATRQESLNLLE